MSTLPDPPVAPPGSAWIAPDVHAVAIDDDLVFLEAHGDYRCLVDVAQRLRLHADRRIDASPEDIEALVAAGLVSRSTATLAMPPPPKPTKDLAWTERALRGREIVAAAIAHTRDAMRPRSLRHLLRIARAGAPVTAPRPQHELLDAAAAFARARPWMPIGGECLVRSFLMLTYLRRLGFDADWVIGVRTWPFRAHCWLQAGDVALDDDAERLVAYTPMVRA